MQPLTTEEFETIEKYNLPWDQDLYLLMTEPEPIKCVACDLREKYAVPFLCETHLQQWIDNQSAFEQKWWDPTTDADPDANR